MKTLALPLWLRRLSPQQWAIILLIVLPPLSQLPALLGWTAFDPVLRLAKFGDEGHQFFPGNPGYVDANAGATTQALGALAARQWLHGIVPWWNANTGFGVPLAAEMQNSAMFVPFVLLLAFPHGLLVLRLILQILCGLFTFALLGELEVLPLAALLGGVLAEFCGTFSWFAHGPIMPVPFLALMVWGILRAAAPIPRRYGGRMVGIAVAYAVAAGFPETAYVNGLLALAIAVWALLRLESKLRLRAAFHICGGGLAGLALSAPAWVPFGLFLRDAIVGQNADFGDAHFVTGTSALHLFPILFGPPLYGFYANAGTWHADIWFHTGGYVDLALVVFGLMAFLRPSLRKMKNSYWGLRVLLGVWVLATVAKAEGVHVISRTIDMIPLIKQTMLYVYASSGWWFAFCILASFALNDRLRYGRLSIKSALVTNSATILIMALVLPSAWPEVMSLWHVLPEYRPMAVCGLMITGSLALMLPWFLTVGTPFALYAGGGLLSLHALLLSTWPVVASGTQGGSINYAAANWMRDHQGLSRIVSFNALAPNYGSFFGLRTLNYTYLPVPTDFARILDAADDPAIDPSGFYTPGLGTADSGATNSSGFDFYLKSHPVSGKKFLDWMRKHGVAWVIRPAGDEKMSDVTWTELQPDTAKAVSIGGEGVEGNIDAPTGDETRITSVGLGLGTFSGHASGQLHLRLCNGDECIDGVLNVASTQDNQLAWIALSKPLNTKTGDILHWHAWTSDTQSPPALWMWKQQYRSDEYAPLMPLRFHFSDPDVTTPYHDRYVSIHHLGGAVPYTESAGCRIETFTDKSFETFCPSAGSMLRRELFFPGWRVSVNGEMSEISKDGEGLFQVVQLPVGHSHVEFFYAPPYRRGIYLVFLLGLLGFLFPFFQSRGKEIKFNKS